MTVFQMTLNFKTTISAINVNIQMFIFNEFLKGLI
jgi:hypothetical protein